MDFGKIYTLHWEKLYAFCYKMTRDSHLAQNIVQDIFTDLWERKDKVSIVSVENYLFRAAKNQVLKEYRKKTFDTTIIEERFEHYLATYSLFTEEETEDKLYTLLQNLPQKRKEILIMNKLEEMDIEQIAHKLNISKQTVKNQLSSAMKQLKMCAGEAPFLLLPLFSYLLYGLIKS